MSSSAPPQPPYPPQGYAPYGYPPPPPQKKHTVRNVLLVLVILSILIVGGCLALLAGAVNEVDKAMTDEELNNKPTAVGEGAAFTHDDFEVEAGWRVGRDGLGGATINRLRVTNSLDEARSALLTFRFYKGNENLGEVECTSNKMQPGEASRMDCFTLDNDFPRGYTEIKVSDMW